MKQNLYSMVCRAREIISHLRILYRINDARRRDVEDASTTSDGGDNGVIIEEVDLEETKTSLCSL